MSGTSALQILLTGGAGYLGTAVVGQLLAGGHSVTVVDNGRRGFQGLAPWISNESLTLVRADVCAAFISPEPADRFDVVVHLAGIVGAAACQAEPDLAERINHAACRNLVEIGGRLVLASTASVYGVSSGVADEDSAVSPISLYAQTKLDAERVVLGAGGTVLRLATLCGVSPNTRFDLMVNEWALAAARGDALEVYGPDAWRPHLHVVDAARAFCAVIEEKRPGLFNVVGENMRKGELANMISDNVRFVAKGDPRNYRVSDDRFRLATGWIPSRTIGQGVREVQEVYG